MDTGLDLRDPRFVDNICAGGHRDFVGDGLQDDVGHGTHIFGQIQKYAPKSGWCAVIVKYSGKRTKNAVKSFEKAFLYLLKLRPDYVNISGGGGEFMESEYSTIKSLPKTKFIAAAGNEGKNISLIQNYYYPASYNLENIIPVENVKENGELGHLANFGNPKSRKENGENVYSTVPCKPTLLIPKPTPDCRGYMSGSSMSTAISTGKILSEDLVDKNNEQR